MDEQLNFTMAEIRRFYTEYTGKAIPSTPRYSTHFEKAAKICISLDATPQDYVTAHINAIGADKIQLPFLYASNSEQHYKDYVGSRTMSLPELYRVQMLYLQNQIVQAKRTVEDALLDDDINFQPWFRVCITKQPVQAVLDKYLDEAKEQASPKLKEFLEKKGLDYNRITND